MEVSLLGFEAQRSSYCSLYDAGSFEMTTIRITLRLSAEYSNGNLVVVAGEVQDAHPLAEFQMATRFGRWGNSRETLNKDFAKTYFLSLQNLFTLLVAHITDNFALLYMYMHHSASGPK